MRQMSFFGRDAELNQLRRGFEANRASLMIIYGRRRIGKSELIREATRELPHVAYQATRVTSALNLEALQDEIARALGTDPILTSLGDEPTVLLQSELRDIHRYASVLAAIADGCTKYGEITGRIGDTDSKKIAPYLDRLQRMRLIRAVRSMDATPNARDRRYFITDPLVAFWHRFVRPNLSSVTQGFGEAVWLHQIAPRLQEFMGVAFEEICREHARRHIQERLPAPAQEIGQIWSADHDIDVVGRLLDGSMLYGECKWAQTEIGEGVLDTLLDRAAKAAYGRGEVRRHYALYARSGFKAGVRERAADDGSILLYSPASMLCGK